MDVTDEVQAAVEKSGLKAGLVVVFCPGSTGGLSTLEYEPGLVRRDVPEIMQKLVPEGPDYAHHATWGDRNGAGHLRSFLVGTSLTIPFANKKLLLGTWQQVVFCEFDEKPRNRRLICQVMGE